MSGRGSELLPAWMSHAGDVAAGLTRGAGTLRAQLRAIEQECDGLWSRLARGRLLAGASAHPSDLADELRLAACAVPRQQDGLDRGCADLAVMSERARSHSYPSAPRIGGIAGDLASRAAGPAQLDAMRSLPSMDTVTAVITGCNGSVGDRRRYLTAWRRIRLGNTGASPGTAG
jgi:hypothetical protein